MDAIEKAAFVTVGKACGFAWLGIFCTVFGFMYEPPLAALVGCVLCLVLALILKACGAHSLVKPYKRTEMWLYIKKDDRPPEAYAQRVISGVLHDTYQWFARQAAIFGVVFMVGWIGLETLGVYQLPSQARVHNVIGHTTDLKSKPPTLPGDLWFWDGPVGKSWNDRNPVP